VKIDFAELRKEALEKISEKEIADAFRDEYERLMQEGASPSEAIIGAQNGMFAYSIGPLIQNMFEGYHAKLMEYLNEKQL
jgi:hypothetical protein